MLCERLCVSNVEIGLVPFGSIGMTLFGMDLYFFQPELVGSSVLGAQEFARSAPLVARGAARWLACPEFVLRAVRQAEGTYW